jgi:RNA polymerase sigma-70 factor (ECF subfamily)
MSGVGATRTRKRAIVVRNEQELIAEALAGDTAAFGELSTRQRSRVEHWCRRFFNDAEIIQDLTQESFVRAFAALTTYRPELPFVAWLHAIATNVCYDELRRRQRRPEDLIADLDQAEQGWLGLVNEGTPEEIVLGAQERRAAETLARKLLDRLRPEDRLVMTLKETEELSVSEIANLMGWSEAKVKIRAFRARQLMRHAAGHFFSHRRGG